MRKWLAYLRRRNLCERDSHPVLADVVFEGKRLCLGCLDLELMERAKRRDRAADYGDKQQAH